MPEHEFETKDVASQTTDSVRVALGEGRGAVVVGPVGSGKTHAVAAAVNGAVWSLVPDSCFAVPRVIADLSVQAGAGEDAVRAYAEQGCAAACRVLDQVLADTVVVFDGVDRLWIDAPDPLEPDVNALWADELTTFGNWVVARCARSRTVAVLDRRLKLESTAERIEHRGLKAWPIKLIWSDDGYLDWKAVSDRVGENAGALHLAASALRFAGVDRMARWLEETQEDESREAARGLGELFRLFAPKQLVATLALLQVSGELSGDVARELTDVGDDLALGLELASSSGLLEERGGVVRVRPYLSSLGVIPSVGEVGASRLLDQASQTLLARVNDRSSLDPLTARRVLDAHRLQLAAGDFDGALTTARLHLGGLISHARAMSVAAQRREDYDLARAAYASILRLLDERPKLGGPRARSYVVHYHGYNGHVAQTIGLDRVAADYDTAVHLWCENALFHARRIALAAERGRPAQAHDYFKQAWSEVAAHPCKESFLRVRPAWWAHQASAQIFALQLLDGYQRPPALRDVDPLANAYLTRLRQAWADPGLELERLEVPDGRELVFRAKIRIRVSHTGAEWTAATEYPQARAHGEGPWSAVRALATVVADECVRLVRTPTGRLPRHEVGRKGFYLGAIDLGLSELGLPFQETRWLIGSLGAGRFVPSHPDLDPLPLSPELSPETEEGMFFARVPVDRAGLPSGPVDRLVEAGSGRTMEELFDSLRRLVSEDDDAA